MASQISEYGANYWSQVLFDVATVPASYFIALTTGLPSEENDGTQLEDIEPTDTAYARYEINTGSGDWGTDGSGLVANLVVIEFPNPLINWGRLEAYNICTAATGGEVICSAEFTEAPFVVAGVPLVIAAGGLSFGLATQAQTISI